MSTQHLRPLTGIAARSLLIGLLLLAAASGVSAQIHDDFSNPDLDPAWFGDDTLWTIDRLGTGLALRSDGGERNDTIHLAIQTDVAFGTWSITFAHVGVNLSTFNGARIFLSADRTGRSGAIHGYFLQLGTNNTDAVSLVRLDGDFSQARRRRELARSSAPLLAGDSTLVALDVHRSPDSDWTVLAGGDTLFTVRDDTYLTGDFFQIWVKHSRQGGKSFYFDDLLIEAGPGPSEVSEPDDPPGRLPAPGEVIVNEVHYMPAAGESEFIELYNRSDSIVDLRGLSFRDARSAPVPIAEESAELVPGGFIVVVQNAETFSRVFRDVPHIQPATWPPLNNSGDDVILEAGGLVIDSLSYGGDWGTPGVSLERIDPAGPSDRFNFGASIDPFGATPGRRNSIYHVDLAPPRVVFVGQIAARAFEVVFDEPLDTATAAPDQMRIGDLSPVAVERKGDARLELLFTSEPAAPVFTALRIADRTGNVAERLTAPVSYLARRGDIRINEIMFAPRADAFDGRPDQPEYVELLNVTNRALSLAGSFWTGPTNELGVADTLFFGTQPVSFPPGAYAVVYAAGREEETGAALLAHFHDVPTLEVVLLPVGGTSLRLRNSGDVIRLQDRNARLVDSVKYSPSWHHPDLAETRGIALERIDPRTSAADPANWTSSVDPLGGTPGRLNSVHLEDAVERKNHGITIRPSPFSPDHDGRDDVAVIAYRLRTNVPVVRIRIFDLGGRPVRTIEQGLLSGSEGRAIWDGRDDRGRKLSRGVYIVLLEAVDRVNRSVEVYKKPVVLARPK